MSQSADWQDRVESNLNRLRGKGLVVAVSGGGDSVALLRLLHNMCDPLDLRLSVAHLNHQARGAESDADAAFVADLAASLDLPFDLGHWRAARTGHFESDARKARYHWLAEVAEGRGSRFVAVAHTRDDQAETILFRILRGTGPRGLAGIPAKRSLTEHATLVRPLLDVSRDELRAYLAAIGQPFREDASNADLSRTRNKIRHDLLPKLVAEYNPKAADALARLGGFAAESRAWARQVAVHERAATASFDETSIHLWCPALDLLPPGLRAEVIRRAWRRAGWPEGRMTAAHWLRLAEVIDGPPQRFSIVGGVDASFRGHSMSLTRAGAGRPIEPAPIPLELPGGAIWGGVRIDAVPEGIGPITFGDERIDLDRLDPVERADGCSVLMVRAPRDGDRFDPLGLGGRTQALNDFFRGRGVKKADRRAVPLVVDRAGIVWVVGHRIAERVKRTEATRRVMRLMHGASEEPGCD